ncbi:methionine ABC transporter ATP-binding protein [Chlamydiota bacterium]
MAIIKVENLAKRFQETDALKGINLSVGEGTVFGIIGMSGAGKSTLIRCLACLERPSAGEIFLKGEKISGLTAKQLRKARKNMGMIFQHFNLFSARTALENIVYPLEIMGVAEQERSARARELLELVGLKGKERHYPLQLSGGECQRVAIARALANNPSVLLCDEATSSLDPRSTQAILELLASLNQKLGLTIVLITHEMEVIKQICTHVAVLEAGEIVEQGTTADLFATPKHPTTKRFLQSVTHAIPEHLLPRKEGQELLRLTFTGKSASQPVISRLIRQHPVEVNILFGGIDILKTETVGSLVVALAGEVSERDKARRFLEESGVHWELL